MKSKGNLKAAPLIREMLKLKNKPQAEFYQRFFRTEPGGYGEGDLFLGIRVPVCRKLASRHRDMPRSEIEKLLMSKFHEVRMVGLVILSFQGMRCKDPEEQERIALFFLRNKAAANNWDLIDVTVPHIIGPWLWSQDKSFHKLPSILAKLSKSKSLWDRRIAMLATFHSLRKNQTQPTLQIAHVLLHDKHDLIHKATGWLLREVGKRNISELRDFLNKYSTEMPRTMLRYAIEKLSPEERKKYMTKPKLGSD